MRFESVDSTTKRCLELLSGRFSREEWALPVSSFVAPSGNETITFKIVAASELRRPGLVVRAATLLRWEEWPLILGPSLVTLEYLLRSGHDVSIDRVGLAFVSLLSFFASVCCLNDYFDHVSGLDRAGAIGGTRVIQRGWWRAHVVAQWGYFFLGLAALSGLRALLEQTYFLFAVACVALISVVGFSFRGRGLRARGLGELVIFCALGAFLTYGFSRTVAQVHDIQVLVLGFFFGLWATIIWQIKNFQRLLLARDAAPGSLMDRFGFDNGRRFLIIEICGTLPLAALAAWDLGVTGWLVILVNGAGVVMLCRRLLRLSSPLSSGQKALLPLARRIHVATTVAFLIGGAVVWL